MWLPVITEMTQISQFHIPKLRKHITPVPTALLWQTFLKHYNSAQWSIATPLTFSITTLHWLLMKMLLQRFLFSFGSKVQMEVVVHCILSSVSAIG